MDEDGSWWCYEVEPHQHDRGWYENEIGRSARIKRLNQCQSDWQQSLSRLEDLD